MQRKDCVLSNKRIAVRKARIFRELLAIIWSWFRYVIVSKYLCTMITEDAGKYEEWLTTIANTRLIYNTMDELETMMDNHSIHNNGMRRCFSSPQKLRAAFRDLKVEVGLMTDDTLHLDTLLKHYQRAWSFYHEHFYRRTNPERIAWELLSYLYPPYRREGLSKKKAETYQQIADEDIHVPFVLLMLLKVVPGYDSKEGDVTNMPELYERAMTLLETFTADYMPYLPNEGKSEDYADNTAVNEPQGTGTSLLPAIIKAREERNKTRLMLLYHVTQVLDTYEAFADTELGRSILPYFDGANFLKFSKAKLFMVSGMIDETCPGPGVHAAFNVAASKDKQIHPFPYRWHSGVNKPFDKKWNETVGQKREQFINDYLK